MPKPILNFIDYLKENFSIENNNQPNSELISHLNDLSKTKNKKKISHNFQLTQRLKVILNKHLDVPNADLDDQAVDDWNENIAISKKELIKENISSNAKTHKLSDFFNMEINPYAHIKKHSHKAHDEGQGKIFAPTWQVKLATLIVMAFILSISIANLNPGLAKKIASVPDTILTKPIIKLTYLYGGESALASLGIDTVPSEYIIPENKPTIDKNMLASYIINNHKNIKDDRINITPEELDGRVAGANAYSMDIPSSEITALSKNNRPLRIKILEFLEKLLK